MCVCVCGVFLFLFVCCFCFVFVCFVVCLCVFAGVLLLMLLFCLFVCCCCCFAQAENCFGRNTEINPECFFVFFGMEVRLARYSCAGWSQRGSQNAGAIKGFASPGFKLLLSAAVVGCNVAATSCVILKSLQH